MIFKYRPDTNPYKNQGPIDEKRCAACIAHGTRAPTFAQCQRKIWRDGWCRQHHPETEKVRSEASTKYYEARFAAGPWGQLERVRRRVKVLERQLRAAGITPKGVEK
jgi:hypothetical protein